jgi:hypothetical protein
MLRVLLMLAVLGRIDAGEALGSGSPLDEPQEKSAEAAESESTSASPAAARRRADPNYSRLMFAPTGRPLRQGDGYFSDHELVFPGFAAGVTDNLSLAGGVSMIPGLGLAEQLAYFSPKIGFQLSEDAAISVGALFAGTGIDDGMDAVGIGFVVGTFGKPDASLTLGLGAVRELAGEFAQTEPVVMIGGEVRLSDSVALVSENWLMVGDVPASEWPFGLALRFFGERLSADVGMVLMGEVLGEGLPIPWVSVSYHFGRGRASRTAAPVTSRLTGVGRRP